MKNIQPPLSLFVLLLLILIGCNKIEILPETNINTNPFRNPQECYPGPPGHYQLISSKTFLCRKPYDVTCFWRCEITPVSTITTSPSNIYDIDYLLNINGNREFPQDSILSDTSKFKIVRYVYLIIDTLANDTT